VSATVEARPQSSRRTFDVVELAAEISLGLVTVSIALGFSRLFASTQFIPGLLVNVVAAHAVLAFVRRRGWSPAAAVLVVVAAAVVVISWVGLTDTLTWGLPTLRTWEEARHQLSDAFAPFQRLVAPVPVTAGFELTMALVVWVLAAFSDTAAFRGRAPIQSIVPHLGVLFATSVFARGRGSIAAATAFGVCAALHLVAQRAWRASQRRWIADDSRRGPMSSIATGAAIAVVAGLVALVLGPATPGARSNALLDLRAIGRGPGPVEVGNPLVGVSNLLGPLSDLTVFTVRSSAPHYWRLTSLEDFDGKDQEWKTERSYDQTDTGELLASDRPTSVPSARVDATFDLSGLGGVWLPTPFEPRRVNADIEVRYDRDSSSLIVGGQDTVPQTTYSVSARVPTVDDTFLQSRGFQTGSVDAIYLKTDGVSRVVANTAREIVDHARAQTTYDEALALQNYFRDGFTYRTDVDYSRNPDPTAAFLQQKEGFCQQFASTLALMARTLHIPSRVAVGFSYGDADPRKSTDGFTTYTVRGRHAHAWPELYIAGAGWLPFEPTPSRGNPDATQYTQVAAQQAPAVDDTVAAPTTTAAPNKPTDTTANSGKIQINENRPHGGAAASSSGGSSPLPILGIVVAALLALALVGRTAWTVSVRRRRRGHRDTPAHRVRAAWIESCDWLELMSIRRDAAETPLEFARRAATRRDLEGLDTLARLETERIFGDGSIDPADATVAEHVAARVRSSVVADVDRRRRFAAMVGWERRN
jgi:transglutaminase-like putative cysteine protease